MTDCTITDEACEDAVDYSTKFIADKKLPDKAIDVIDVACARLRLNGVKDGKIDHEEIIHEISVMTGISIEQLSQKQASNLKNTRREDETTGLWTRQSNQHYHRQDTCC